MSVCTDAKQQPRYRSTKGKKARCRRAGTLCRVPTVPFCSGLRGPWDEGLSVLQLGKLVTLESVGAGTWYGCGLDEAGNRCSTDGLGQRWCQGGTLPSNLTWLSLLASCSLYPLSDSTLPVFKKKHPKYSRLQYTPPGYLHILLFRFTQNSKLYL